MNDTEQQEIIRDRMRRRKRIRLIILACLVLVPLLTWLETRLVGQGTVSFPVSGNVLVFVLINLNLLLLLLMVFLVLRNLAQLVFERRRRFLGTRLRSKLVIAFVSMSFFPTLLLFFIALQFVSTSMDYWFNANVARSLEESIALARNTYQEAQDLVARQGSRIGKRLETEGRQEPAQLEAMLTAFAKMHGLAALELVSARREVLHRVLEKEVAGQTLPEIPIEELHRALAGSRDQVLIQPVAGGELVRGLSPLSLAGGGPGVLVTSRFIPQERLDRLATISSGYESYRQLMLLKSPIKTSLLVLLLIVTLLIVFCAIWFAFYIAAGLTGPIGKLAEATRRVAEGELDFVLEKSSGDEMGTLVESFNRMTRDLSMSKRQLEEANRALEQSRLDAETRRRHMEIVLRNVGAGVISIDEEGRISSVNRFAEELLKINAALLQGRAWREVLRPEHRRVLEQHLDELAQSGRPSIERELRLTVGGESFLLKVNFTRLEDENAQPIGVVLVFDNLTELEKAQRMAAWREVARRIAHEVKNPLTPIQLSAQRLRKKYLDRLAGEEVFDSCTRTIINQVDELKNLVGEFSRFARMPVLEKTLGDLAAVAGEIFEMYQEAHGDRRFLFLREGTLPPFSFDAKQIRRVLINLFDNAVAATEPGGEIELILAFDPGQNRIRLELADNGVGVSEQDKARLFEPYFSTKKGGTGLGLAIAATVIADHHGSIRVRDNHPAGTRMIVELPLTDQVG